MKIGHEFRLSYSRACCVRFFGNVDYLRRVEGITKQELADRINDKSFRISPRAIARYTRKAKREYRNASIYYLAAFAGYFEKEIGEMLLIDYEAEGKANGVIIPRQKYNKKPKY